MKKLTKALAIGSKVKEAVRQRDSIDGWPCCIYCGSPYAFSDAHYIPRSHLGLGIEENILTLCRECHEAYDRSGKREEMKAFFKDYLQSKYPDWNENDLVYKK